MAKSGIIGYGIAFGVGIGLGYMLFSQQPSTTSSPPATQANNIVGTRWTSGYQGSFANGFPEAGISEKIYAAGQYHKMTGFSPAATTAGVTGATANGSIIYVD